MIILGFKHFIITKMNINSRYNRDWRYHKEDRVWITRAPGMAPSEKTQSYERGTYYFFDVTNWRYAYSELLLLSVTKLRYLTTIVQTRMVLLYFTGKCRKNFI